MFGKKPVRIFILALSLLTFVFLAGGQVFAATSAAKQKKMVSKIRQDYINYALSLQGVPYVYGGKTPRGFDCSGFVKYSIREGLKEYMTVENEKAFASILKARSAQEFYDVCSHINEHEREPGDLIFFTNGSRVNHIGIYLGKYHSVSGKNPDLEGKRVFISAVSDGPKTGVVIRPIDERYWKSHFYGYGRFLGKSQPK